MDQTQHLSTNASSTENNVLLDTNIDTPCTIARSPQIERRLSLMASIIGKGHKEVLPAEIEAKRKEVRICPELPIATHPALDTSALVKAHLGRDEHSVFHKLTGPFLISNEIAVGNSSFHFVDKMRPHAQYEIMLTQSDSSIKSRFIDLDSSAQTWVLKTMVAFAQFCQSHQLFPVCSFSIDPDTFDRKSGQSSKRFHVHLVARTHEELEKIEATSCLLSHISPFAQRRLVDESAVLLSMCTADWIKYHGLERDSLKLHKPFENGKNPFISAIPNGTWESFTNASGFAGAFSQLQSEYEKMYQHMEQLLTVGTSGFWQRPRWKNELHDPNQQAQMLASMAFLSEESRNAVSHFIKQTHPELLQLFSEQHDTDANRGIISHLYPHSGASYSVTISGDWERPEVTFRPFLYSDTGGAGLSNIRGIVLKTIKRNEMPFNESEMEWREDFQRAFLKEIGVESRIPGWRTR